MSNAPEGERLFIGLDIETTGTDNRKHVILEIGAIVFELSDLEWLGEGEGEAVDADTLRLNFTGGDAHQHFHGVARVPEGLELDEWITKTHTKSGLLEACKAPEAWAHEGRLCEAFLTWFDRVRREYPKRTIVFFGRNVGSFDRAFIEEVLQEKLDAYHRALDLSAFFEVCDLIEGREARKKSEIEKVEIEGLVDHRSIDDVLRDLVVLSRIVVRTSVEFG